MSEWVAVGVGVELAVAQEGLDSFCAPAHLASDLGLGQALDLEADSLGTAFEAFPTGGGIEVVASAIVSLDLSRGLRDCFGSSYE
jgi:hypothetical protein